MGTWLVSLLLPLAEKLGVSILESALSGLEAKWPGITPLVQGILNWVEGQSTAGNPAPVAALKEKLQAIGVKY